MRYIKKLRCEQVTKFTVRLGPTAQAGDETSAGLEREPTVFLGRIKKGNGPVAQTSTVHNRAAANAIFARYASWENVQHQTLNG